MVVLCSCAHARPSEPEFHDLSRNIQWKECGSGKSKPTDLSELHVHISLGPQTKSNPIDATVRLKNGDGKVLRTIEHVHSSMLTLSESPGRVDVEVSQPNFGWASLGVDVIGGCSHELYIALTRTKL